MDGLVVAVELAGMLMVCVTDAGDGDGIRATGVSMVMVVMVV